MFGNYTWLFNILISLAIAFVSMFALGMLVASVERAEDEKTALGTACILFFILSFVISMVALKW